MKTTRNLINIIIAVIFIWNIAAMGVYAIEQPEVLPDAAPTAATAQATQPPTAVVSEEAATKSADPNSTLQAVPSPD
ncbi:MAG: hypothetical protein RSA20_04365, partial [Oscillospiraceae bacterium]